MSPGGGGRRSAARAAAVVSAALALSSPVALAACGSTRARAGGALPSASGVLRDAGTATTGAAVRQSAARVSGPIPGGDWSEFDFDSQRSGSGPPDTGITGGDLGALRRRTVRLPGTVDSAPIELHSVRVRGRTRDVVFMTTSYGITIALDPATGHTLWRFEPADLHALEGGPQVTTATPIADPGRRFIYAASPNGYVHKLRVSDGRSVWATRVTLDPTREKLAGALNIGGRSLIVATDGYDGDQPPYQGHVVTVDRGSGRITHVWYALCSWHRHLIRPSGCSASDAAIWGRSGSVVEPGSGRILIATGNGRFNGTTDWGDSVLELSPSLRLLHNYTPANQAELNSSDTDLGSTEPALIPPAGGLRLAVQGGKDGVLRLLDLGRLDGARAGAGRRTGGALQAIDAPGPTDVFTEPAVWSRRGRTYVFVSDEDGSAAYVVTGRHRLAVAWSDGTPGTSPVVAGGLLYVYDQRDGTLLVRDPLSGRVRDVLAAARGHWNSPIVVGGRIILPEGDDNDRLTRGTLDIYHLPGR